MSARCIAVVQVVEHREQSPDYQQIVDHLNVSALQIVKDLGWDARFIAAGDEGTKGTLQKAREADVILLMGGEDVHPSFYGGPTEYPRSGAHSIVADEAQIALAQDAATRGTPLLGICRGHQLLNVAFGGDLIQHLPPESVHRNSHGKDTFKKHSILLDAASGLAGVVRPEEIVQSSHHQAVDRVAEGFRVVARGDDGVVEAIVHESAPITGVQWHPEHRDAPEGQLVRLLRRLESQLA